jgi:hypothetical protein
LRSAKFLRLYSSEGALLEHRVEDRRALVGLADDVDLAVTRLDRVRNYAIQKRTKLA